MTVLWRGWMRCASALAALCLIAFALSAASAGAEALNVTSSPAGAKVEIDGVAVGVTPFHADYPGGYFHKTHTVFGSRLEHKMTLRVSKDGYVWQQITLTDGPFDWIAVTGKHHGKYFLLRADHFDLSLEPVAVAHASAGTHAGPIHPRGVAGFVDTNAGTGMDAEAFGTVVMTSDPADAEIYVDGKFVGQTPATIPLAAGEHRLVVKESGKKDWERELTVLKASQVVLRVVMEVAN
jgi:hypothetical protein